MINEAKMQNKGMPWRLIGWSIPLILLLLPLVSGAPWTLSDYLVMGMMFLVAGLAVELAMRASVDMAYRAGAALAVSAAFLLIWVNLAVGFLGSEDNPVNRIFFALLGLGLLGSLLAGFRAAGMVRAMLAVAAGQAAIGVAALAGGWGSPGAQGLYEILMGTGLFTSLWLAAAWLFALSTRRQQRASTPA